MKSLEQALWLGVARKTTQKWESKVGIETTTKGTGIYSTIDADLLDVDLSSRWTHSEPLGRQRPVEFLEGAGWTECQVLTNLSLPGSPGLIAINSFQHVAVTYDKASGIARLFHNGQVVKEQYLGTVTPQTSYDLYMGYRPSGTASGNRFYGLMDEVSLYNRALKPAEILSIFEAGATGKCSAPKFGRGLYSRVWLEGGEQVVRVSITGVPTPTLQWYFNGQPISGATNATLSIASVKATDGGVYTVAASNAVGQAISRPILVFVSNVASARYPGIGLAATAATASQIEYRPLVGAEGGWSVLTNVVLSGNADVFIDFTSTNAAQRFYRATGVNRLSLGLYNTWEWNEPVGTRYQVECIDIGSGSTNWQVLTNLTLATSPYLFIDYEATNAVQRFYRATPQP